MQEISTDDAPPSIGPFSQAVRHGDTVYVSGQGPIDPDTGEIASEDVREQTRRTLENVATILAAAGTSIDNAVKATVFLTDMDHYDAVNEVYAAYVSDPYPARSAVQVVELPVDIHVEIEVIAAVEG
ncbi:Rid family detoxifying hydrolase [Halegenticoccus soli]|uniref:Rid family detoxifying hydrolase n=1 Tax=Halegenticoccus soli TaxID=1985678 RepID=UPI000C6DB997|nr:Rid family detoxifying hydrolase [Halegenticoccus soli]